MVVTLKRETMPASSDFRYDFDALDALPADVDRVALRRMDFLAYALDDGVAVPGTDRRVGVDPVLGVVPVAGDAVAAALSLAVVARAALLGVDRSTLAVMVFNIAVDLVIGSVPVVGDLFDAAWKANRRNVGLVVADLAADSGPTPAEATVE